MKKFLRENKIIFAIVIGSLIVGAGIYFGLTNSNWFHAKKSVPAPTKCLASPETIVTKVIDGDTVVVEGGYHVRLLGIDADEKGYPCYEPAKKRLEELVLNKDVRLEKDKTDVDKYKRCLRYIFLGNENIDLELVKEGLAVARFYEPDVKYQTEIQEVEREAIEKKVGCKWKGNKAEVGNKENNEGEAGFQWQKLTTEKLGYDIVNACQAGKYLGRELIAEGKVADAYHHLKSNTVFLDFGKPYPNSCFTGVIFSSDLYKFVQKPEDYYLNKTVRIMGEVKEYQGRPEIILESPSQIEIGK